MVFSSNFWQTNINPLINAIAHFLRTNISFVTWVIICTISLLLLWIFRKNVVKLRKKLFYYAIYYYKQYGFGCVISTVITCWLALMVVFHFGLDQTFFSLMGLLFIVGGGAYKAHNDKDKKNELVFQGRRECFDCLRGIIWKLYTLPRKSEDFTKSKSALEKELTDLYIKAEKYFGHTSRIFVFLDQTRNAAIHYLYGVNELSETDLWKGYMAANEFLMPFLKEKEFLNRRREFELDIFKPETFAPIWTK